MNLSIVPEPKSNRRLSTFPKGTVIQWENEYWAVLGQNIISRDSISPNSIPVVNLSRLVFDGLPNNIVKGTEFTVLGMLTLSE